ncbi:MAG: hypothetical protein NC340_07770 [Ruminococcus flavefaciens]|nr:hypothetical protein [Ruminococcus flavefaciens]MCM1229879.1 hypothetical protein [Ruminococcus flavefaciens]
MALYIYSIDEAVDRKYVVTKSMSGQAKAGTLVHIMDCSEKGDGSVSVSYRVTETGQNFNMDFANLKQFCKWARPDNFIARHYENLSSKDILYYIKVTNRTFVSFYLPIMIVALVLIWIIALALIKGLVGIIAGAVLSIVAVAGVIFYYKYQKKHVAMDIYSKVSSNSWGVVIK